MRFVWLAAVGLGGFIAMGATSASALQIGVAPFTTEMTPTARSVGSAPVSAKPSSVVYGSFDISLNFSGTPTASQVASFQNAEAYWESKILGYRDPGLADFMNNVVGPVVINANFVAIDGPGNTLASAGATNIVATGGYTGVTPSTSNVIVTSAGSMNFDTADVAALEGGGNFDAVIIHEMAHVLGFTSFFWDFVLATDGTGTDTSYTGANGLAAYQAEFDPLATFVPVEDEGGSGTAYSHWDEQLFASYNPLAPVAASTGNPELMTGYLDAPTYTSMTTIASFEDLGYATVYSNPVPLPLPGALLAGGLLVLAVRSRKRG
ncbi:leishmanolysin-related zinc metalloendopeptidase [Albimonas sp. CAU 1670]|uniref:leishmanolysin-related zinc metalloendopeptidase n=1 Tax=Albimonas sp. CAU 1670 TaxID=3032599 RepID=UPI0023DCBEC3|nr:leishmanolysin-related zinc metalloendopeptidase [Albimonas sp. CAU 1670]MDF2232425.1 leishmanolysin-related zinc metalloendopeptidase [Albimonas sp. CAU 1670]